MNSNFKSFKDFVKEITTLRTVWIDKGQGRWAVKRKMHPVLKGIFLMIIVISGGLLYSVFFADDTQANVNFIRNINEPSTENLPVTKKAEVIEFPIDTSNTKSEAKIKNKNYINNVEFENSELNNKDSGVLFPEKNKNNKKPEKLNARSFFNGIKNNDNNYRILVNKSEYKLSLFKGDELVKQYPIAVGRNSGDKKRIGDHRTPVGNFKVVSIENASSWSHDFRDGKGKIKGAYGPWFLRLDAKGWKGIGIHGTHDPDSRGTNATEGCVRLSNEDIQELRQYAYLNMPVVIREN